jgi:hypothetical protein
MAGDRNFWPIFGVMVRKYMNLSSQKKFGKKYQYFGPQKSLNEKIHKI